MRTWLSHLVSWRAFVFLVIWGGSVAMAAYAGAWAYPRRARIVAMFSAAQQTRLVTSNLYNLSIRRVSVPAQGRDGGIDPLADGVLFVNRLGSTWYVDPDLNVRGLALRVPINFDDFEADPYNVDTVERDRFAVKDLLVQERPNGLRVATSYNYWYADEDCYSIKVATLDTTAAAILSGDEDLLDRWRTVYETPCGELTENPNTSTRNPTLGSAGRLAPLSDNELLVTIGGFGPETIDPRSSKSQSLDNPFGKTILIDTETQESRIFTLGHRNPEGLAVSSNGEIWLTEHAERGGDELNRLIDGANYGFPLVSYGTQYESMVWSINPRQGRHAGFEKPTYAWVPSIGISQPVVVEGARLEHWRGDILVSALAGRALYRVRVEDGRTIFVEPIPVEHRIRDITETADGTIVLKTDDDFLLFIRPVDELDLAEFAPEERGELMAAACTGCHSFERGGSHGIGPNLWGLVGSPVASREGYEYSASLTEVDGRWTPDRLTRFLADPAALAPGTTMVMSGSYRDTEVADIVAYIETLR